MSNNTVKASDIKAVPFFARFLEEQVAQAADNAPYAQTKKWPSDWEDI
ncbi:MAG: microviridin/marinostatin family tricyclic proteinase inhibitor [Gloeotrichia echinulata CP02]|jgi:hypothetical protein|nr:microviridin/marinostatin family tricyclic proteinase inhibitor [Gloeotrichia echinulata DEX184]